jgi:hypothetical protein
MNILVLIDWQICVIEYRTLLIWLEVRGLHKHMRMELGSKKAAILTLAWWLLQLLSGSSGQSRYWFREVDWVVIKLCHHFVVPLELRTSWDFYFWLLFFVSSYAVLEKEAAIYHIEIQSSHVYCNILLVGMHALPLYVLWVRL